MTLTILDDTEAAPESVTAADKSLKSKVIQIESHFLEERMDRNPPDPPKSDFENLDAITKDVPYTPQLAGHLMHRIITHYRNPEVLELACGYGKITPYLGKAADAVNGRVRAIDHEYQTWEGKSPVDRVHEAGVGDVCDFTFDVDARWYTLDLLRDQPGRWIDFVYLDLSHTIEIDAFVALAVWTHLRPGGIVVFDDLDWSPGEHGTETDQNRTNRPNTQQMQILFDYIRQQPDVGDQTTWGEKELNWRWGFIQKMRDADADVPTVSDIIEDF